MYIPFYRNPYFPFLFVSWTDKNYIFSFVAFLHRLLLVHKINFIALIYWTKLNNFCFVEFGMKLFTDEISIVVNLHFPSVLFLLYFMFDCDKLGVNVHVFNRSRELSTFFKWHLCNLLFIFAIIFSSIQSYMHCFEILLSYEFLLFFLFLLAYLRIH